MGSWVSDLGKEEAAMLCVYKLTHGLLSEDIRGLHLPGDVRTKFKEELEMKVWFRNGLLPIETHSVIESRVPGWALSSVKLNVWFVRPETEEALVIPMPAIKEYLKSSATEWQEVKSCKCKQIFLIMGFSNEGIADYRIQYTTKDDDHVHIYHSACLFVKEEAFPMRKYFGAPKQKGAIQYSYVPIKNK